MIVMDIKDPKRFKLWKIQILRNHIVVKLQALKLKLEGFISNLSLFNNLVTVTIYFQFPT